jgi:hypothetical protein
LYYYFDELTRAEYFFIHFISLSGHLEIY